MRWYSLKGVPRGSKNGSGAIIRMRMLSVGYSGGGAGTGPSRRDTSADRLGDAEIIRAAAVPGQQVLYWGTRAGCFFDTFRSIGSPRSRRYTSTSPADRVCDPGSYVTRARAQLISTAQFDP